MQRLPQAMSHADHRVQVLQAGLSALERVARDVRGATDYVSPAVTDATSVSVLEFSLPDFEKDGLRLPASVVPDDPSVPLWNPRDPAFQVRVVVRLDGDRLKRFWTVGGVTSESTLLEGCHGFAVERVSQQQLELRLTLSQGNFVESTRLLVWLPMRRAWRR